MVERIRGSGRKWVVSVLRDSRFDEKGVIDLTWLAFAIGLTLHRDAKGKVKVLLESRNTSYPVNERLWSQLY